MRSVFTKRISDRVGKRSLMNLLTGGKGYQREPTSGSEVKLSSMSELQGKRAAVAVATPEPSECP